MTQILILEDDIHWIDIIKKSLLGNFTFDSTGNIQEVEHLLKEKAYDLIIADLDLNPEDEFHNIFEDINKLIFSSSRLTHLGGYDHRSLL